MTYQITTPAPTPYYRMTYQVTAPAATSYNTVAELKTHLLLFGDYPTIKYSAQPSGRSGTSTYAGYITYTTYMSVIPQKLNRAVLLVAAEMFESRREVSGSITYAASLASRRLIQSLRGW